MRGPLVALFLAVVLVATGLLACAVGQGSECVVASRARPDGPAVCLE